MKTTRTVKARKSTGSRGCSESDQEQVCSYTIIVVAVVVAVMFVAVDVIVVFVVFLILSGQNEVYLA